MSITTIIIWILCGYAAGSIPFGKIVSSRFGVDIQKRGSGNIGFANVRRVLGWKAGILTLCGDILKGYVPALTALLITNDQMVAYCTGLAAVAGHIFPVWLKFNGGKGIATGLGLVLALNPIVAAGGALVYIIACTARQKSSTASLLGVFTVFALGSALTPSYIWQYGVLLILSLYTLRHNILGTVPNHDA